MTTAVIAEDETLLAETLAELLDKVWPDLRVAAIAPDGEAALAAIRAHRPDVVFLDIRMPRKSGLEVAQALAQGAGGHAAQGEGALSTDAETGYAPLVVFVTAYDQYAIDAFESAAADYLLKPVSEERLERCVARVRDRLAQRERARSAVAGAAEADVRAGEAPLASAAELGQLPALQQLMQALAGQLPGRLDAAGTRLRFIRASLGDVIRQIPVDEVLYLEAQDKYVAVITRDSTALVRTPLSELLAALDPDRFVQIHRSTVVRVDAIDTIRRDITGRQFVHLRERAGGREVKLPVSRQYAGQFRGL
ncbi:MAG: response regulator transcription factor [Burkholderiaceae bacterium]|nr:response regulator transcription factor [Burkholderiaceae bacterium]MBP6815680.1 response regulator transcription factor [Burkholderiaceae bacterium]MBP7661883.1 response regulator transcription factor [Burkholderiaceae bacterium]